MPKERTSATTTTKPMAGGGPRRNSLAVQLPADFDLPAGAQVTVERKGNVLLITPVETDSWAFMTGWGPLDVDFPRIEDLPPADETVF